MRKRTDALAKAIAPELQAKDVLEVACGSAEFSLSAVSYAKTVSCIDLDDSRLSPAIWGSGVEFRVMDAALMEYPEASFDTVVLYNAFAHVEKQWVEIEKECKRVLRPGGALYLISTWKLDISRMTERFGEYGDWVGNAFIVRMPE